MVLIPALRPGFRTGAALILVIVLSSARGLDASGSAPATFEDGPVPGIWVDSIDAWAQGQAPISGRIRDGERSRSPWWPDYAQLQFAGNIGFLSLGTGYSFLRERVRTGLQYGWSPALDGSPTVHALAGKAAFAPFEWGTAGPIAIAPAYLGGSTNVALGKRYKLLIGDRHRDYYWPSALHFTVFAGTRIRFAGANRTAGTRTGPEFYAEAGTLDSYLQAWLGNESIGLGEILSLALGGTYRF